MLFNMRPPAVKPAGLSKIMFKIIPNTPETPGFHKQTCSKGRLLPYSYVGVAAALISLYA